jgi:GT2 family glycosyltransferase/SAM-dependent methyltransferase
MHKRHLQKSPRHIILYFRAKIILLKYNYYQKIKYWTHHKIPLLVGNNKYVLEIGCSTGYLSKRMKENGCYVVGVENNEESARIAKKNCDEIIIGDIEDNQIISKLYKKNDKFDVIVLGDVLEHCKNPSVVLQKMTRCLGEKGYLVVSVPNVANINIRMNLFFRGRFHYCKHGILDEDHLRFFTLSTLKQSIVNCGLSIEKLDITPGIKLPLLGKYEICIRLLYYLSKLWKTLFAYQFLIKAVPTKSINKKKGCRCEKMNILPKVSIIVLNWNGLVDTKECLESLQNVAYENKEIIVVDNGSSDGSQEYIRKNYHDVILLENNENLGYAEGNNRGIQVALEKGAEYIFLLNNDTLVDNDAIFKLIEISKTDARIGFLGPKIYYYSEPIRIWSAGGKLSKWFIHSGGKHIGYRKIDRGQFECIKETDYVSGCAILIKKSVFEQIGLFDPKFFCYYEEADLIVRSKRKGFKVIFVPKAKVWHKISSSLGANTRKFIYYQIRNRMLFTFKHTSKKEWNLFITYFLLFVIPIQILKDAILRQNFLVFLPVFEGIADFFHARFEQKKDRFQ